MYIEVWSKFVRVFADVISLGIFRGITSTSYNLTGNSSFMVEFPILKGLWNHSPRIQPCLSHARPLQAIGGIFLAFNPPMYFQKTNGTWSYPVFANFVRSISVFHPVFFSEKSRFFMEIFPEIEGPSHQPNKIHQFPCVFFSSVPQVCLEVAMHGSVKVPSRSSVSSDLVMDIIWKVISDVYSMMYICVRILYTYLENIVFSCYFFWGGGENIAQTCKMTRSIE